VQLPGVTVAVDGDRGAGTDGAGQGDWWDGEYRTRQRLTIGEGMIPASGVAAAGRVGLFSTYGTHLYADDMVVRRFVDPEPTVRAGAPETVP
jgi:hypothetical protein